LERSFVAETALAGVGRVLGLGEPFVPPLYQVAGRPQPPRYSLIAADQAVESRADGNPAFAGRDGQRLHTDGTLQDIAEINTTLLLCEQQATDGGETLLFNAVGAFAQLVGEDPEAAVALTGPGVLVRQANINGSRERRAGPAFAVHEGRLVTRYSVDETDSWALPPEPTEALGRGIAFLERAAEDGSEHSCEFRLGPRQILVLANSMLAHGRRPYRDSDRCRRRMLRSLHTGLPVAVAAAGSQLGMGASDA
jgi:hypothetical protein